MATDNNSWLCRHCNNEVHRDLAKCPLCGADRPEETGIEESDEVVVMEDTAKDMKPKKKRYLFRESVLINAADIILILGIFCSFAALIAPMFIDNGAKTDTIYSIVGAITTFLASLITWALFRNIAEISRMLRRREEKELND
jgi:hypothetical protein